VNVLALLGRRQHRLEAERLEGEFARPALRVVKVLVLLVLDLGIGFFQRLAFGAGRLLGHLADQPPVGMVLGLGDDNAVACHALRGFLVTRGQRSFHGLD